MNAKINLLFSLISFFYFISIPAFALEKRVLVRVFPKNFFEFDPGKANSIKQYELLSDIGEGLLRVGNTGKPEPGLAKSWDIDTSKKTITFQLRDQIYWSNGNPIIANDFILSWQRSYQLYPNHAFRSTLENIQYEKSTKYLKITAPTDKKIIIHFKKLDLFFPYKTLFPPLHPVPSIFIKSNPSNWSKNPNLPYNGAYKVEKINYESGILKYIRLTANGHYYKSNQVKIKKITYTYINTKKIQHRKLKLYQDSSIDAFTSQRREDQTLREKKLISKFGYKEVLDKALLLSMLLINKETVNNKLQQAIKLITDPGCIIKRKKHKTGKPIYRILYNQKNYTSLENKFNISSHDRLKKAKELLASLDISKEKPVELNLHVLGSLGKHITRVVAGKLGSHGIKINYNFSSLDQYLEIRNKDEKVDLVLVLWHLDTPDIVSILDAFSYSGLQILTEKEKETIELMSRQASKSQPNQRQEIYNKIESIILNKGGIKPLLGQDIISTIKNDICGWSPSETLIHPSMWLYSCPE